MYYCVNSSIMFCIFAGSLAAQIAFVENGQHLNGFAGRVVASTVRGRSVEVWLNTSGSIR